MEPAVTPRCASLAACAGGMMSADKSSKFNDWNISWLAGFSTSDACSSRSLSRASSMSSLALSTNETAGPAEPCGPAGALGAPPAREGARRSRISRSAICSRISLVSFSTFASDKNWSLLKVSFAALSFCDKDVATSSATSIPEAKISAFTSAALMRTSPSQRAKFLLSS